MDGKHLEQRSHLVRPAKTGARRLYIARAFGCGVTQRSGAGHDPEPFEPGALLDWPADELEAFGMTPQTCDREKIREALNQGADAPEPATATCGPVTPASTQPDVAP